MRHTLCKSLVSFILVLSLASATSAQNRYKVSGFITDIESGESLPGATVMYERNAGISANSYGFYSLDIEAGRNELRCTFMGYEDHLVEIVIECDTTLNIRLTPRNLSIEEVRVEAKVPLATVNEAGKVSVNVNQLKYAPLFLGEQDIFKYLHMLPGISAGKEGSSGLNIRGGSSDQTLILLDDVPIYNQAHAFGFVSIFNGEALKTADVYKGYVSPEYGGRLSGVTALTMRDGNRREHRQSLQIGTLTAAGMVEGPFMKNKGAYIVSGRYFVPALFLSAWSAAKSGSDDMRPYFGFYDLTAKLTYDLDAKNSLYASFYMGHDNLDFRLNDFEGSKKISKSKAGFGWGNTIFSLRWSSALKNNMFLSATAYCSMLRNEKHSSYENTKDSYGSSADINSGLTEFGGKVSVDHHLAGFWKLNYGVVASLQKFTPQKIEYSSKGLTHRNNYGKMSLVSYGAFLNNRISLGSRFSLDLGGRAMLYDNRENSEVRFEPRLSASVKIDGNSSVWVSYVENTQPLFSMNRYYFAMPVDYWVPFEVNRLQRSQQAAIGGKTSLFSQIEVSAEIYYKRMRDLSMVYDVDSYLNDEGGIDDASGSAYGFELSLQHSGGRHNILASYSYSKSERKVDGRSFPFMYDTPHDLNVFGIYDVLQQKGRKHTLSINVSWKTGLPYVISNESYPSAGMFAEWNVDSNPVYSNTRLINYFRTDISYNMERVKKNGVRNWQFSLLNVTGHKNPYILYKKNDRYRSVTLIPFMPSFAYKRTF